MTRVHINIPVQDLERSIHFYSKLYGAEPSKVKADYANFRLEEPALHLALVKNPAYTGKDPAFDYGQHFGIELFNDETLQAWKERLKASGILPHLEEEQVTCCYAVADKFWMQDPDGNEWEFWVRTNDEGDTLFNSSSDGACCAPAQPKEEAVGCCIPEPAAGSGCCS